MSNEVKQSKPFARASKLKDCAELAVTMREEDKQEIWHFARSSPLDALKNGYSLSRRCFTIEWNGKVVAMFGVVGEIGQIGVPWMLASDELPKIRKSFLKEAKKYLEIVFKDYPVLANYAWAKNTVHLNWLKWLGFTLCDPEPMGVDDELFISFYMRK